MLSYVGSSRLVWEHERYHFSTNHSSLTPYITNIKTRLDILHPIKKTRFLSSLHHIKYPTMKLIALQSMLVHTPPPRQEVIPCMCMCFLACCKGTAYCARGLYPVFWILWSIMFHLARPRWHARTSFIRDSSRVYV